MNEVTYKASYDTIVKIMSGIMVLAAIGVLPFVFLQPVAPSGLILEIIIVPTTGLCYLYSVKSYTITTDKLIINRRLPMWNKEILLSNIEAIKQGDKDDFSGTIRTFGAGGLFGYYGSFRNGKLGNFTMNVTNRNKRVVILLKKPKQITVISPDDTGLVDEVKSRLKS